MSKKRLAITMAVILIIFLLGFILRVETTHITGIPTSEKAFYQDQNGLPYMYEMDSYYNYRLTKNYLDHGYMGDAIVNGTQWDWHSYAPSGVPMDYPPLIAYLTALVYKFLNLFSSIPLLTVCFWLPAFLGPLAGVVAYFFTRRFTNEYGAAAAGILAVTAPLYFMRTVPGWFDTDMFNVFFPLLVTWLFVEAVQGKNIKNQMGLSILTAFSMFLFALAWNGWQYQFYLLVLFCAIYILWRKLRGNEVKNLICTLLVFSIGTLILVGVFTGFLNILKLFASPAELLSLSSVQGPWSPWPDIYVSVSELTKPSLQEVISGVGIALFTGLFGLLWIFRVMINKKLKKRFLNRMSWFFYSLLVVWILIGVLSLKEGERFIMLLIPPLVVSSGIMVGLAADYLSLLKKSEKFNIFRRKKNLIKILSLCVLLLIAVPAVLNVYESFSTLTPGVNDDMWDAAVWINNNTSNDTVVITSWSYGHFFSAIADRPVAFDGRTAYVETLPSRQFDSAYSFGTQSPSTSREYWIDRALVTNNESLSLGIFNMIATNGDLGYITLDKYTGNTTKSVEILNNILGVNKTTALNILMNNYNLNQESAENVLQYTHPSNPHHFVLVTNGLKGLYWIFQFGTWDFNKMESGNYNYSYGDVEVNKNILNTTNNVTMNLETGNVTWNGQTPYCLINVTKGDVKKQYINVDSSFCVILLMDTMQTVVIDKQFENSTFTKLWLERSNSTVFKQVYENENVALWEPKATT
ncbi:STT3 domain-containing protein [Methanobacterium paludis]|uniref:dolichyl-phosphooligosaccharide-protein glycotransferase n=1 Tax=Methanobacterium paludis (strain DSM 25820 / JCM 18151 / SWAN1) TaxID=868131 RepID=F6D806_METPW|nr:STT3 domain-containing protein [Methanobacterium paludis]AEG18529.1 Oligosaccharyl transferase STT3 subunit [Methanobacterium paludis]